jgi:hypothetical protein
MHRWRWMVVVAVLVAGCASTALTNSWVDPTYHGPAFKNILVVGWTDSPEVRQQFENIFVEALKTDGIAAVASYTVMPTITREAEAIAEARKLSDVDGVIITRVINVQNTPAPTPMQPYGTADMALYRNTTPTNPNLPVGQGSAKEYVLGTDVYEVPTGKMVWWGQTTSFDTDSPNSIGMGTASRILGALRSAKLL